MDSGSSLSKPLWPGIDAPVVLQEIINTIPYAIEVLRPVRKGKHIIDFEFIVLNETALRPVHGLNKTGKKFLTLHAHDQEIFDKLKQVAETGISQESVVFRHYNGSGYWYNLRIAKLQDVVICGWEDVTARKKAETVVENFKSIADFTHDAICSLDPQGHVSYWNPAAISMYGYSQSESAGRKIDALLGWKKKHSDLAKAVGQVYQQGQQVTDLTTQVRRKDGKSVDIMLTIFPLKNENGHVNGACLVAKDMTEASKSRHKMKEDAHFIGQIIDTTPDIIYIMDLQTRQIIYANRQVAADLGYTREDIAAMKNPVLDILHPEDIVPMTEHLKMIRTLASDDHVVEIQYRLKKPDGGYAWYCDRNTVFKRNSRRIPVEKIGICQNITTRKLDEDQRQTVVEIIHQSEQVVNIGSWGYDISTNEFQWSEGMYRLFNIDPGTSVRPEVYLDYTPENERPVVEKIIKNITEDFIPFEETVTLLVSDNEKKIVKIKAIVKKDKKDKPLKVIGVDLDITQQFHANEEIKQLHHNLVRRNEELRTLGDEIKLFNVISAQHYRGTLHQLYTNLEYIISHDARHISDTGKANIRRAQAAIQKMNLLTADIHAYFGLYDLDAPLSLVDPNEIIGLVVESMQLRLDQHDATVDYENLPLLLSNSLLFSQLVSVLIDHSLKYRNLLSPLVIKIRHSNADELNAVPTALRDTPYTIISYTDNGIGFNEEESEQIFDLGYQLSALKKKNVTGVGLAICKRIMAMHDGFITAEGHPAKGATFNCFFPFMK